MLRCRRSINCLLLLGPCISRISNVDRNTWLFRSVPLCENGACISHAYPISRAIHAGRTGAPRRLLDSAWFNQRARFVWSFGDVTDYVLTILALSLSFVSSASCIRCSGKFDGLWKSAVYFDVINGVAYEAQINNPAIPAYLQRLYISYRVEMDYIRRRKRMKKLARRPIFWCVTETMHDELPNNALMYNRGPEMHRDASLYEDMRKSGERCAFEVGSVIVGEEELGVQYMSSMQ